MGLDIACKKVTTSKDIENYKSDCPSCSVMSKYKHMNILVCKSEKKGNKLCDVCVSRCHVTC